MWGTTAAFAALAFPLACYGIDFSADPNFEITIHCGDTPVVLKDPGFSQVKSQDVSELKKLIEEKMQESLKRPACQEMLENPEESSEGEVACPVTSGGSSTATPTTTTDNDKEHQPTTDDDRTGTTDGAKPATTPVSPKDDTTGSDIYNIQRYNNTFGTLFIGRTNGIPRCTTEPALFRITSPGLEETADTVSFELLPRKERGNPFYLTHNVNEINLRFDQFVNSSDFKNRSTFRLRKDLNGTYAYESYDNARHFIWCSGRGGRIQIKKSSSAETLKRNALFHQKSAGNTGNSQTSIFYSLSENSKREKFVEFFEAIIHLRQQCVDLSVTSDRNPKNNSTEDGKWVLVDTKKKYNTFKMQIPSKYSCQLQIYTRNDETVVKQQNSNYSEVSKGHQVWLNVTSDCHYDIVLCDSG